MCPLDDITLYFRWLAGGCAWCIHIILSESCVSSCFFRLIQYLSLYMLIRQSIIKILMQHSMIFIVIWYQIMHKSWSMGCCTRLHPMFLSSVTSLHDTTYCGNTTYTNSATGIGRGVGYEWSRPRPVVGLSSYCDNYEICHKKRWDFEKDNYGMAVVHAIFVEAHNALGYRRHMRNRGELDIHNSLFYLYFGNICVFYTNYVSCYCFWLIDKYLDLYYYLDW